MKTLSQLLHIALLLNFCILQLFGQDPAWERINPLPSECSIKDIALLPNDRIITVGTGSIIMITDDFGGTWDVQCQPANVGYNTCFYSVSFVDENIGYIAGNYLTLLKTEDGASTWTQISEGHYHPSPRYEQVSFHNENIGYLSAYNNRRYLLKTIDGGDSWDTLLNKNANEYMGMYCLNQSTLFLYGSDSNYYCQSSDGGYSWDTVYIDYLYDELYIFSLHFIDDKTGFLGAVYETNDYWTDIILKSGNGGETWYEVFSDPFANARQIYFLNHNIGFALGTVPWYRNSLLRTENSGESWQVYSKGLGFWRLNDICMNKHGEGLMVGDHDQIYMSNDFGKTWDEDYTNFIMNEHIFDAKIIGDSTIIAVSSSFQSVGAYSIIRSTDAGQTWSHPELNGQGPCLLLSLCFINETVGYATGRSDCLMYYKTVDGGQTWNYHYDYNIDLKCHSVYFITEQTGFIGGYGQNTVVYKTTDGGNTWIPVQSEAMFYIDWITDIEFKDDSTGYIVGTMYSPGAVVKTEDGGNTWFIEYLPFNYEETKGICFCNTDTGFLYGYNTILKTTDGGSSWDSTTINLPGNRYFNFVHFATSETGYATSDNIVFKSTNGGESWDPLAPIGGSTLNTVNFFTEELGIAMGDYGVIYRTTNGGTVFTPEVIDASGKEYNWRCYPNPFHEKITFISEQNGFDRVSINIYDLSGNLVYSSIIQNPIGYLQWEGITNNRFEIPKGIYLCEIRYDQVKETLKMIKM